MVILSKRSLLYVVLSPFDHAEKLDCRNWISSIGEGEDKLVVTQSFYVWSIISLAVPFLCEEKMMDKMRHRCHAMYTRTGGSHRIESPIFSAISPIQLWLAMETIKNMKKIEKQS